MFLRRVPLGKKQKLREVLWPSMGFRRLAVYYRHRMGRLPGTPEHIAKGMATGIAISFTPFVGFHILLGTLTCWLLEGSILSMVLGSVIGGNVSTLPLIWIATYKLGRLMLHKKAHENMLNNFTFHTLFDHPVQVLLPMTLGCLPMMLVSFVLAYYLTLEIVRKYKAARLHRLQKRAHQHEVLEHGTEVHAPAEEPAALPKTGGGNMILGVGTDLASITRIAEVLEDHDARFTERCFGAEERTYVEAAAKGDPALRAAGYAKRWAAKEACAKALGLGIYKDVFLKDIVVINDNDGKPSLRLTGGAKDRLTALTPQGMTSHIHVSLSDEPPLALAFVVVSAEGPGR